MPFFLLYWAIWITSLDPSGCLVGLRSIHAQLALVAVQENSPGTISGSMLHGSQELGHRLHGLLGLVGASAHCLDCQG